MQSSGSHFCNWVAPVSCNYPTEEDSVVLEVTFITWPIHSILKKSLARIVVADSMKVKAIAWARIKSDKVDAHILAHLLRVDFIPEIKMPDEKHWDLRQIISHRESLSHRRAKIKGHMISLLHQNLVDSPHVEKFCKKGMLWFKQVKIPSMDRFRMDQHIEALEFVENQIAKVDEQLVANAKSDPRVSLLMTIPGFGLVVATGFLALIEDIKRFDNPKQVSSYFGLVPRLIQSGEKCLHGRITKYIIEPSRQIVA
jgi:transposase